MIVKIIFIICWACPVLVTTVAVVKEKRQHKKEKRQHKKEKRQHELSDTTNLKTIKYETHSR